ncbi:hypothetical protein V1506DRAFT_535345 [Lipomyces tetrasporus]
MAAATVEPQPIRCRKISLWKDYSLFHLNSIDRSSSTSDQSGLPIPTSASHRTPGYQDRSLNLDRGIRTNHETLKNSVTNTPVLVDTSKSITIVVDPISVNPAISQSSQLASRDLPVIDSPPFAESIATARREFIDASREAGKRQRNELQSTNIASDSHVNITDVCLDGFSDGSQTYSDELRGLQVAYIEYCSTYCRKPGLFGIKRFLKSMQGMAYYPISEYGSKAFEFVGMLIGDDLNEEEYAKFADDETQLATHAARVLRRAMSRPQDNIPRQFVAPTGVSARTGRTTSDVPNTSQSVRSWGRQRSADAESLHASNEPSMQASTMTLPISNPRQSFGNATYLRRNMHPRTATCLYCEREEFPVRRKEITIKMLLDRVEDSLANNDTYAQHRHYSSLKPFWSLMSDRILSEMEKQIGHLYSEGYTLAESIEDIDDCSKALYWAYEKRLKVEQALEGGHTIKARLYRWFR